MCIVIIIISFPAIWTRPVVLKARWIENRLQQPTSTCSITCRYNTCAPSIMFLERLFFIHWNCQGPPQQGPSQRKQVSRRNDDEPCL